MVIYSAVLSSYFLGEDLGVLGGLGCAICLIGSIIIVLHAPADEEVQTIDEILNYAIQPCKRARYLGGGTNCRRKFGMAKEGPKDRS